MLVGDDIKGQVNVKGDREVMAISYTGWTSNVHIALHQSLHDG